MSILTFFLLLCSNLAHAQINRIHSQSAVQMNNMAVKIIPEWSPYKTDSGLPGLKVRERHYTIGSTQKIDLEVQCNQHAKGSFTTSVCNENRTMNGWQTVNLAPNTPQILHFETANTCNNGWWWQVTGFSLIKEWTAWSTESGSPLKACMRYNFDQKGQKFLQLQLVSTQSATFEAAIKVCQSDDIGINGWRKVQIKANTPIIYNFQLHNNCEDGWWWQYRNYKRTPSPGFGDDMELNPSDE